MSEQVNPSNASAYELVHYATIAADKDLMTEDPRYVQGNLSTARLPREIHIMGSGNFVFQTQRSYYAAGADITYAVTAPYKLPAGCIRKIDATTTCTQILVLY